MPASAIDLTSLPRHAMEVTYKPAEEAFAFCYYGQHALLFDHIAVGDKVTLKATLKTALVGSGVWLAIRGDNKGSYNVFSATTQGEPPIGGNHNVAEHTMTIDSFPDGIDRLIVYAMYAPNTTGSVSFDNLSLLVH